MKDLFRQVLVFVLLALSTIIHAFSQEKQNNDEAVEMAKMRTEVQKQALHLTVQQEVMMYDINLKYIEEMLHLRNEGRSVSTLKKLKAMSDRMDEEVVVLLNEDQYKEYLKLKDERRKEMVERMRSQRGKD